MLVERNGSPDQKMFVTILFGDSKMEMLNLNCKLINFISHLKERSGLDFKECVELMDSRGRVMNLEGKQHSAALTSSVLAQRQHYILLQVCRDEDTGDRKYLSLNNFSRSCSDLTELLRKLSDSDKERDGKKSKRGRTFRSKPAKQITNK